MISGTVNESLEAIVRARIVGRDGMEREVEALIDTGFDGWLTLPPQLIADLSLRWNSRGRAVLADGTISSFDVFEAIVHWNGEPRAVIVDCVDAIPLVGMALVAGFELCIAVKPEGRVMLVPLADSQ